MIFREANKKKREKQKHSRAHIPCQRTNRICHRPAKPPLRRMLIVLIGSAILLPMDVLTFGGLSLGLLTERQSNRKRRREMERQERMDEEEQKQEGVVSRVEDIRRFSGVSQYVKWLGLSHIFLEKKSSLSQSQHVSFAILRDRPSKNVSGAFHINSLAGPFWQPSYRSNIGT